MRQPRVKAMARPREHQDRIPLTNAFELFKGLHRLLLLLGLGFLLFCLGCGKKGPPVAPQAVVPPPVKDLKAELAGDEVQLTWSVTTKNGVPLEEIEGFRVFKRQVHGSVAPCPECPVPFNEFLDIKLKYPAPARVEGRRVFCRDKVVPEGSYTYKVIVYHKSGGVSQDSNIVSWPMPHGEPTNTE